MKFINQWKIPQNTKELFSPSQEKVLKEKYGIRYTIILTLSINILFIPFIIFYFKIPDNASNTITQLDNSLGALGFILGFIGSLTLGISLVNILSIFIKQYLSHFVTLITLILGISLNILAIYIFSFINYFFYKIPTIKII